MNEEEGGLAVATMTRRERPLGMLREHAFARSIETCPACSKLGTQGIMDAIDAATSGFCAALRKMGPGEKERDDVLVDFTAAAMEAGLCRGHATEHARIAMRGMPESK